MSPDGGRVYVAGYSVSLDDAVGYAVVLAYDAASGAPIWRAAYPSYALGGVGPPLAVNPDGSLVYVAVSESSVETGFDFDVVAINAKTGHWAWAMTYSGEADNYDTPQGIAVLPSGAKLFVTGATCSDQCDVVTLAYDARTGAPSWVSTYDDPDHVDDVPGGIGVSPDGQTVLVAGAVEGGFSAFALDASTGAQDWLARHETPPYVGEVSLAVDPMGRRIYATASAGLNYGTIAWNASRGTEAWYATYSGHGGTNDPRDIGTSPDGSRVYVTGASQNAGLYDYATVAYAAQTGAQLAVDRYAGSAGRQDEAQALAVASNGWLYVTGYSFVNADRREDYLTIAYGP